MLRKMILGLLGTGFCMVVSSYSTAPAMRKAVKPGIKTIIIDAGHGGSDPGAHGDYSTEKKVCLAIALKLGQQLKEVFPEIKIIFAFDRIFCNKRSVAAFSYFKILIIRLRN